MAMYWRSEGTMLVVTAPAGLGIDGLARGAGLEVVWSGKVEISRTRVRALDLE